MGIFDGISFGWLLLVFGTLLLVVEAFSPGFFVAVPGTVLIIIGILLILGFPIFGTSLGVVVGVFVAMVTAGVTIWIYSRFTQGDRPFTLSRDSVIGLEGMVVREVNSDIISGKVRVSGQIWSAKSENGNIPKGTKVRVISSEGVHVVVEKI